MTDTIAGGGPSRPLVPDSPVAEIESPDSREESSRLANRDLCLSIGLCLWNEEGTIDGAIRSLLDQDIFSEPHLRRFRCIEIVCLANGCKDRTAEACRRSLEHHVRRVGAGSRVRWRVDEVPWSGLARALNYVTHRMTDPQSAYMVKMDADVEIVERHAIRALIEALEANRTAQIATPRVEKHFVAKQRMSLVDRFSLFASRFNRTTTRISLSGALYCGRTSALRSVWQVEGPQGLDTGTDVHVRDMLVTDQFRYQPSRPWREDVVIRVPSVTVYFEAYTGLAQILYHQKRRVISNVCRSILHRFLRERNDPRGGSELIRELNESDPDWFSRLVESRLRTGSRWVLPRRRVEWSRVRRLGGHSWIKRVVLLPAALAMECCDLWAVSAANRDMRRRTYASIWRVGR